MLAHKIGVLKQQCEASGRPFEEIEISTGVDAQNPAGSGEELFKAGATLFTVGIGGPDYHLSPLKALLKWRDSR